MDGSGERRIGLKDGQVLTIGFLRLRIEGGPVNVWASHASGARIWSEELRAGEFDLTIGRSEPLPGEV